MIVELSPDDVIVHQASLDPEDGVPVVWAIVAEAAEADIFNVLYREADETGWFLHWRGSWAKCRDQYETCVTEAVMGDTLYGLPADEDGAYEVIRQETEANKVA